MYYTLTDNNTPKLNPFAFILAFLFITGYCIRPQANPINSGAIFITTNTGVDGIATNSSTAGTASNSSVIASDKIASHEIFMVEQQDSSAAEIAAEYGQAPISCKNVSRHDMNYTECVFSKKVELKSFSNPKSGE